MGGKGQEQQQRKGVYDERRTMGGYDLRFSDLLFAFVCKRERIEKVWTRLLRLILLSPVGCRFQDLLQLAQHGSFQRAGVLYLSARR
jgi:hypothetical protein